MTDRDAGAGLGSRPRCGHCGEIIGVYEPMVLVDARGPRHTSLAAELEIPASARSFHRACHLAAQQDGDPSAP